MMDEYNLVDASARFDYFKPVLLGGGSKREKIELDTWLQEYGWRQEIELL